ncbi:hypothetical protein Adt_06843 [Abeliophyllum distichum]|uniref:Uncharacterized protein n=1 Tax=Abeliophyllum distichum TaxID=126358 RepID=A0ABD1V841_9LAMI
MLLGVVGRRRLLRSLCPWKVFCLFEAVYADTGEVVAIPTASLREAEDPYRADVVRWAALDSPSIMVAEDMRLLRDAYRIPSDIEILLPDPNERACFSTIGMHCFKSECFCERDALALAPFF